MVKILVCHQLPRPGEKGIRLGHAGDLLEGFKAESLGDLIADAVARAVGILGNRYMSAADWNENPTEVTH
jgi:hypothetical protein